MKQQAPFSDPTYLSASLAASDVGTWDYDVAHDRLRYCRIVARLYGLPPEDGSSGVSIKMIAAATHPEDRAESHQKLLQVLQRGGAFVFECRVTPSPQMLRWVLVRGFYEVDETGQVTRGRGIAIDVTEGKQEGYADGDVFFVTEADDSSISALDRVTKYVLAARRGLEEVGPEADAQLKPATDALLLAIAQHIVGTMMPGAADHTRH